MTEPNKENTGEQTSTLGAVASAVGDIALAADAASSLLDLVKDAVSVIADITPDV